MMKARKLAKIQGDKTYLDSCLIHGETAHSTHRGLCLGCYDTLGKIRSPAGNPAGYYVSRSGRVLPVAPEDTSRSVYVLSVGRVLSGGQLLPTSSFPKERAWHMVKARALMFDSRYLSGQVVGDLANVLPDDEAFPAYLRQIDRPKLAPEPYYVCDYSYAPDGVMIIDGLSYINRHEKGGR